MGNVILGLLLVGYIVVTIVNLVIEVKRDKETRPLRIRESRSQMYLAFELARFNKNIEKPERRRKSNGIKELNSSSTRKNAESVSFEDKFLKNYEEAVKAKELEERQIAPSEYIRPSSMYGCERMLFSREYMEAPRTESRVR